MTEAERDSTLVRKGAVLHVVRSQRYPAVIHRAEEHAARYLSYALTKLRPEDVMQHLIVHEDLSIIMQHTTYKAKDMALRALRYEIEDNVFNGMELANTVIGIVAHRVLSGCLTWTAMQDLIRRVVRRRGT